MNALLEAIKHFNFSPERQCTVCNSSELEPKALLEHLDKCDAAKKDPEKADLLKAEILWQEQFMLFRNTEEMISHGGRPFDDNDCCGCESYEDHEAGKCKRNVKKVYFYQLALNPILRDLVDYFTLWLIKREKYKLHYLNSKWDNLEKESKHAIEVYEKKMNNSNDAETKRTLSDYIENLETKLEKHKKMRETRMKKLKNAHLRIDKLLSYFIDTIKQIYEEDLNRLQRKDEARARAPPNYLDDSRYNDELDKHINSYRLTASMGEEIVRERSRRPINAESLEDFRAAESFFQSVMMIESRLQTVDNFLPRLKLSHEERISHIRLHGAHHLHRRAVNFADRLEMIENYNNVTGWFVFTFEELQRKFTRLMDSFRMVCDDEDKLEEIVHAYSMLWAIKPCFSAFTEAAMLAMRKARGFVGFVNSPLQNEISVTFREDKLRRDYESQNLHIKRTLFVEISKHREAVKDALLFMEDIPTREKIEDFLSLLTQFAEEDEEERVQSTSSEIFENLLWTIGEFDFGRPQPGIHMLPIVPGHVEPRMLQDEFGNFLLPDF